MTMYVAGEWRGADARGGGAKPLRRRGRRRRPDRRRRRCRAGDHRRGRRSPSDARALGIRALGDPAQSRRRHGAARSTSSPARSRSRSASRSSRPAARRRGSRRSCARAPPRARACTARRCRSTRRRTAPASWRSRSASHAASSSRSRRSTIPRMLVTHKVGPALAAGNAVVLKPARQTPLTALFLTRRLLEAGLPENAIQCLTGSGSELGPRALRRPAGAEDQLHGLDRRRGGDHARGRRQAPLARARGELPAHRPPRRRSRPGRGRDRDGRIRQRRPGVHLRPAGARGAGGVRRVRRAAHTARRGPAHGPSARRADGLSAP